MGSFETDDPGIQMYGWVAERQRLLIGDTEPSEDGSAPAEDGSVIRGATTDDQETVKIEPLAERLPLMAQAYGVVSRLARHEQYVPDSDRLAFIGGRSATVDMATLEALEEAVGNASQAQTEVGAAEAQAASGLVASVTQAVRGRLARARERRAERDERIRRSNDVTDLKILMRLYAGEPGRALEVMRAGQASDSALAENAALLAAYRHDPVGLAQALARERELGEGQLRRLQPEQVAQEQLALRLEWADRRREGMGLKAGDADRYAATERLRAGRAFDASGAVADKDMRAEREAALAEARIRNQPDGKVLIVTDENIPTPGLIGPLVVRAGATEVHTAGTPYHRLTCEFLEGITGAEFHDQLPYNDVNQRYALIILQGYFPPIKPDEVATQIGGRVGDMAIIPGDVDETFVSELRALLEDRQSKYFGKFTLTERPSSLVLVHSAPDGTPVTSVRRGYERPTYLLVCSAADAIDEGLVSVGSVA